MSEWTKRDWTKATDEERIEALYLLIDENNEDVDAGTSAIVSVDGFTQAFEGADENTTLGQIFAGATYDEVTFEKDELLPSKTS